MGKHTPGPWKCTVYENLRVIQPHIEISDGNLIIASVPYVEEPAEANSRLISASPELFQAIVDAEKELGEVIYLNDHEEVDDRISDLRAKLQNLINELKG